MTALSGWWFTPAPRARIAWLRTAIYLFVVFDMAMLVNDVVPHGYAPAELYQPTLVPRLLHLPTPTPVVVHLLQVVLLAGTLVAATGRLPRLAGWVVATAYLWWIFIGMGYGKIDHDHFALVVTLFALPTVGAARHRDSTPDEATGFALRCVQVAVVLSYFLAAWAKMRWGGWGWANGAVFYWAMSRRGTALGHALLHLPWALHLGQWMVLAAETLSPLLLVLRGRALLAAVGFFLFFHLATYLTIGIHFLPLVVCFLAFAPLERLAGLRRGVNALATPRRAWPGYRRAAAAAPECARRPA